MTTHTQQPDTGGQFTGADHGLYAAAFQALDPTPTRARASTGTPRPSTAPTPAQWRPPTPPATAPRQPGAVEKTLTDALAFLDTHGWAKRTLIHPEGARCSIGALRGAAGARTTAYRDAGNLLLDEARRQHGKQWTSIPSWNDSHTGAQVRSVWEAAIRRAHSLHI